MQATVKFVQDTFNRFNDLCFDGGLPPIRVVLTKARTFVGKLTFSRKVGLFGISRGNTNFSFRISSLYDLEENEWEDVVIHEMIHYFIALNGIRDCSSHGTRFRAMMNDINTRYGRHITISHKSRPDDKILVPNKKNTEYIVCLSEFAKGGYGVTVCAATRVRHIKKVFDSSPQLISTKWIVSTDPFFSKFPRSRSPRIYRITEDELKSILAKSLDFS